MRTGKAMAGSGFISQGMDHRCSHGGFTLIEILLSLAILVLAVPILASVFPWGTKQPAEAREQSQAVLLAQELMEEVLTRKWDENATPPGKTNVPSTIGLDAGEVAGDRSTYDDIDDYDGFVDSPMHDALGTTLSAFTGFWSQVSISYVGSDKAALDLDTLLGPAAGTDFKRVEVDVNWADGSATLTTVRGNF
jgi:MSHA pilin protein MshD